MDAVTALAVQLDIAMLQNQGVDIASEDTPDDDVPYCNPADHLGHRLLIKYVRADEADKFNKLTGVSHFSGRHYLTPTPIACRDLMRVLALPPTKRPQWALLLRPDRLTSVRGPRRIKHGFGVEYILEDGFSSDAMDDPPWVCEYK